VGVHGWALRWCPVEARGYTDIPSPQTPDFAS
jgi:hypothetical protein